MQMILGEEATTDQGAAHHAFPMAGDTSLIRSLLRPAVKTQPNLPPRRGFGKRADSEDAKSWPWTASIALPDMGPAPGLASELPLRMHRPHDNVKGFGGTRCRRSFDIFASPWRKQRLYAAIFAFQFGFGAVFPVMLARGASLRQTCAARLRLNPGFDFFEA